MKKALAPLGNDYAKQLDVMLEGGAIDVYPTENKSTGAFAMPVSGTHPYILLNYTDDYNSVFFTQAFFARFQEAAVREVENGGTLTADKLDELRLETTRASYGPEYAVTNSYAAGWARIPHFYNGFYVYQYAVGISVACNIADRIQSGDAGAVEDYLTFLKAGDSGNVVDLLTLAGVDISSGNYINAFTERFERLLKEFE